MPLTDNQQRIQQHHHDSYKQLVSHQVSTPLWKIHWMSESKKKKNLVTCWYGFHRKLILRTRHIWMLCWDINQIPSHTLKCCKGYLTSDMFIWSCNSKTLFQNPITKQTHFNLTESSNLRYLKELKKARNFLRGFNCVHFLPLLLRKSLQYLLCPWIKKI